MAELTLIEKQKRSARPKRPHSPLSDQSCYRLMLLPGVILLLIFAVVPMFGIVIAFQTGTMFRRKESAARSGSDWTTSEPC